MNINTTIPKSLMPPPFLSGPPTSSLCHTPLVIPPSSALPGHVVACTAGGRAHLYHHTPITLESTKQLAERQGLPCAQQI